MRVYHIAVALTPQAVQLCRTVGKSQMASLKSFHGHSRSCLLYTVQLCLFRRSNFQLLSVKSAIIRPLENFSLYTVLWFGGTLWVEVT